MQTGLAQSQYIEVFVLSIQPGLVQAVAAFVPATVVRGAVGGRPPKPGDATLSEGAALFADIVGFTPMAERLARVMRGQAQHEEARSAEELNRIINQTFSAMMEPIRQYGGVVSRFSGDALTAFFERPEGFSPSDVVTSTLACAHDMQQALAAFAQVEVGNEVFAISVKIGIGYGPVLFVTVGDEAGDMESVLAGPALDDATAAEFHGRQDKILLAPSAWSLLESPRPARRGRGGPVSNLQSLTPADYHAPPPLPARDAAHLPPCDDPLAGLDEAARERVLQALSPYLPKSVYDRVVLAWGDLPGDYRRVTNLFVFFDGLDFAAPSQDSAQGSGSNIGEKAQAYYRWAHAIVERYGGRLIRILADDKGTALHILFGAPDKRDDDPVHGLRCALALQHDPDRPGFIVQQRIGVASGLVFAGAIGSPTRREYTVIGNEVNLSSRLTSACPPGEVLVDIYTRDRTAQQFVFESLPPMQLKGRSEPVVACRLLAERPAETGLVARYLASRWRIVGREAEVAALTDVADLALSGQGRSIAIEGRAGVGKTRLVEEVVRHWVDHGGDGFLGQAVSHGLNSPYHAWASFWHAFFDFHETDSAERRWQKVNALVADEAPDQLPWLGVLAPVLGLPSDSVGALPSMDAADRRRKLFEVTLGLLQARAQRQPLLVLFEDIHWADRPSLELIDYVSERIRHNALLLCLCFRPRDHLELELLSSMECTWRILDELDPEQSAELVRAILGEVDLSPALEQEIYDKTQGNPLFVEEILNSLVAERRLVFDGRRYRLLGDSLTVTIPDTLQDLLMARIDRLEAPSRDLVQVASIIDRRFSYAVLRGIYPYLMSGLEMQERLNELVRPEDLTRLDHPEPDPIYLFKHALTRDVAYASVPFARRRELHPRVAEFIEATYTDRLEEHYGTLAYHFDQGEQWERALIYSLLAGVQAQTVYANDEALRYYRQVEECLAHVPGEGFWISALQMLLKRNVVYRLNGDYEQAEADLSRALSLAGTHGDSRAEAEAYCLLADLRYYQMRNEESLAAARQAHAIALANSHPVELNAALVQLGIASQMVGDIDCSMDYLQQAHDLAEKRGDRLMLARALSTMAVAWWLYRGELDQALDGFRRVLEIRREAGARDREAECLANIANVQFRRGDFPAALEAGRAALEVGRAAGWQYGLSYVQLDLSEVHCYLGDYEAGQRLIEEAEQNLVAGDDLGRAYIQLARGRNLHCDLGRYDAAVPMLEASLGLMREHDHYEEMIRALTALGESHLRRGHPEEARTCLQEAHSLCVAQHFPWQRSEIGCRLGEAALATGRIDEAIDWAQKAEAATTHGSGPDWLGPIHLLLAHIAQAQGASAEQTVALYKQAIALAQARCRAIEKFRLLHEAGRYLAAQGDTRAGELIRQAEEWLAARSVAL
jgi:class 3 adenylate cyclase/tetratricopeptide (TPR) repeat protein